MNHLADCQALLDDVADVCQEHSAAGQPLGVIVAALSITLGRVLVHYYDQEQTDVLLGVLDDYVRENRVVH